MARKRNNRQTSFIDVTRLLQKLDDAPNEIKAEIEEFTIELAEFGADRMRTYIKTRGTNKTWGKNGKPSGWWSKKTNRYRFGSLSARYDSGDMLRAVGTRIARGPQQSRATFGWTRDREKYFTYQEEGFYNVKADVDVPGMFALRDARRDAVREAPRIARKYQNRISRMLNK